MYAHLFENQSIGLARNLFWAISIDFPPLQYAGSGFNCRMACEWIPWGVRDWRKMDGESLDVVFDDDGSVKNGPSGIEAFFYMTAHDPAQRVRLKMSRSRSTTFKVVMDMVVNFHGYDDGDADSCMRVIGETEVSYDGVIIVKDNIRPKPTTEKMLAVADKFIDLAAYEAPIDEDWRWVFPPKTSRG